MANTFELISSVTVGSGGASSIDFTSIPSTFTDLVLKLSIRSPETGSYDVSRIYFNNNQAISYSWRFVRGSGSAANSSSGSSTTGMFIGLIDCDGNTANTFSSQDIYIPNYLSTNNKSVSIDSVQEQNGTAAYMELTAGLAPLTTAINQITIITDIGSIKQYSTAYLYGVKNA